jgi:precorrin-6B methylase 2
MLMTAMNSIGAQRMIHDVTKGLITIGLLCLPAISGCAQEPATDNAETPGTYTYNDPSRDGTGKVYMGREISFVMGHRGASWLERPGREREERTDLLLENLGISPGDNVADIGAGTGYFSLPMAALAGPEGKVFAVDIQPEMLAIIEQRSAELNIDNVERVLASSDNPNLPAESINLALFVDAYHEFESPREVMTAIYDSLVPGGRVVLIEYRMEDPDVPIKLLHKMSEAQARKELTAAGFRFAANESFLPQQHFLVFEKPL